MCVAAHVGTPLVDCRKRQTATATPAEPGGLPLTLESEIVNFPRIMLTKVVVDDALASEVTKDFADHIKQAADGPYFLHVLWRLRMRLDIIQQRPIDTEEPEPELSYFATIREMVQRRFAESVDTPKHFEKVQWFARYWNDLIIPIRTSVDRISGPGLDEKPGVLG